MNRSPKLLIALLIIIIGGGGLAAVIGGLLYNARKHQEQIHDLHQDAQKNLQTLVEQQTALDKITASCLSLSIPQ